MKILATIIVSLALCIGVHAQNPTLSPSTFTAEDSVTITVDVTGTTMAGQTEAYIWIFAFKTADPSGAATDGSVNGTWTNSNPSGKMTSLGGNKWRFGFTSGTVLFGLTPADLTHGFGFLVKAKDGSKQTANYQVFFFDPLVFTPSMLRIFPAKVDKDDVITVNFDKSLGGTVDEQRMTPVSATITMFDETGAQVGNPLTVTAKKTNATIWAASFIPSMSFTPTTGHTLNKFRYKFNGTVLNTSGAPVSVSSSESEIVFTTLK
ncbi:MAG: hypothetical protein QM731_21410 [Chitinophagaceae bacterium]